MHSRGKLIKCSGHGPLQASKTYKVPWEDVWIEWTGKPGRKRMRFGPTLIGYVDLCAEIPLHEELVADAQRDNEPDLVEAFTKDLERLRKIKLAVDTDGIAVDERNEAKGIPSLYTTARTIDRKEAEKMLAFYLKTVHGIHHPSFKWLRTKFCVNPVSVGGSGFTDEDWAPF